MVQGLMLLHGFIEAGSVSFMHLPHFWIFWLVQCRGIVCWLYWCVVGSAKVLFSGLSILVRYFTPSFFMLTYCLSKIASHPVLHRFPLEMRELCGNPGIGCAFLTTAFKCGSSSVKSVVYDSWLPYADETYIVWPFLCSFQWVSSCLRYVSDYPVSACLYFVILYMLWLWPTLLKNGIFIFHWFY